MVIIQHQTVQIRAFREITRYLTGQIITRQIESSQIRQPSADLARDRAGERITRENQGLKVVAEAKRVGNIPGEIEIRELQTYDPVLLVVPALDADEAADGAGGGVGEIPGESVVVGVSQRATDFAQAVEVIFGGGERGQQQREGE